MLPQNGILSPFKTTTLGLLSVMKIPHLSQHLIPLHFANWRHFINIHITPQVHPYHIPVRMIYNSETRSANYWALARIAALLPVTAWKPDLILATEHLEPHVSHCRKNKRSSFCNNVSGDLHVWHVTYSSVKKRTN